MNREHERPTHLEILYLIHQYNYYHRKTPIHIDSPTEGELAEIRRINQSDDTEYVLEIDNMARYLWDSKQFYARMGECIDGKTMWTKLVESVKDFLQIAELGEKKAFSRENDTRERQATLGKRVHDAESYTTAIKKQSRNDNRAPLSPMKNKTPSPRPQAATPKLQKEPVVTGTMHNDPSSQPPHHSDAIKAQEGTDSNKIVVNRQEKPREQALRPALKKHKPGTYPSRSHSPKMKLQPMKPYEEMEVANTLVRNKNEKQMKAFLEAQRLASEVRKFR